ncbi:hypothetical protein ACFQER_04410 [Halomicroarcula sp. GCM10025894]|uniref:hypothetical protein n=1 Tax=Halomicroarcula sp. GCM10025894 TaxID=3252673 RepID=UPI003606E87C
MTAESTGGVFEPRLENVESLTTVFTFCIYSWNIFVSVTRRAEKLFSLRYTLRTVDPVFIRGIVLELGHTYLTFRLFFRTLPVAVLLTRPSVTVLTVRPARFRVVEIVAAFLAGPIRQWIAVDLRMVLAHPLFGVK